MLNPENFGGGKRKKGFSRKIKKKVKKVKKPQPGPGKPGGKPGGDSLFGDLGGKGGKGAPSRAPQPDKAKAGQKEDEKQQLDNEQADRLTLLL